MQVSETKDHITHAVVGGGETIDFGISTSAEFFNILSSTLYKDQKLAVVREVLCNAWDAHIEAGCTHIPVEITLNQSEFIIKDFGNGIHRDDMGMIYGTYGNSTKKNDGNQTGGFGLGCKAPFAYTDHFEVTSCHDKVKTIYNLSKSSAQAMGKPGIVPIMSVPTLDTGLQVKIPVKNQDDYHRFFELVYRIASNGDMNMKLNGNLIDTLGFDTSKGNVLITLKDDLIEDQDAIMVRYGNVIYPVDKVKELLLPYAAIEEHLNKLAGSGYRHYRNKTYYIIFQASPHSIAVQPSREGLSMQGHTINTLNKLFADFLQMLKQDFPATCDQYAVLSVDKAVKEERIPALLSTEEKLPITQAEVEKGYPVKIADLDTMAKRFMESNYPNDLEFRKRDIKYRLTEMMKAGLLDRGLVQTYLRALEEVTATNGGFYRDRSQWVQKVIVGRLAAKLMKAGLSVNNLFAYDPNDQNAVRNANRPPLIGARGIRPKHLFNALPYLRNIVVLSSTIKDLKLRAEKHEVLKKLGNADGFLFYHVGTRKKEKEEAIAFFKATKMQVVDLTIPEPAATFGIVTTVATLPRKKYKKGVVKLSAIMNASTGRIDTTNIQDDDVDRTETPEFVVEVSLRADMSKNDLPYPWDRLTSRYIIELFGDKGGITNKRDVYEKWIERGAVKLDKYVFDKVAEYMKSSPTIQEYWAYNPMRICKLIDIPYSDLIKLIYDTPTLRKEYGLVNNLTEEDNKYLYLWNYIIQHRMYRHAVIEKSLADALKHLEAINTAKESITFLRKFCNNKLMDIIDESKMASLLRNSKPEDPLFKSAMQILNSALNYS